MFLFSDSLYKQILLDPIECGADTLNIVSGFATPTMATKHIIDIKNELKKSVFKIELIVGMIPRSNIGINSHENFKTLMNNEYGINFSCKYVHNAHPVHSKVYVFSKNGVPVSAFVGSANYTQMGFGSRQLEIIGEADPKSALNYYQVVEGNSIICNHPEIEDNVAIVSEMAYRESFATADKEQRMSNKDKEIGIVKDGIVTISLLTHNGKGDVGWHSGLNWGQRDGRNPNQAYISLPSSVYTTDFFPPRGSIFTILTDDNKSIICARAQDNAKAIHSTANNALLGEYFRNRLGLANGQNVTKEDLEKYGRTDVSFSKIDDETYYMDFSINQSE